MYNFFMFELLWGKNKFYKHIVLHITNIYKIFNFSITATKENEQSDF